MTSYPGPSPLTRLEAQALEVAPWDLIAPKRARDLDANRDPSYRHVIAPAVGALLGTPNSETASILDVGCGVGRLTRSLAERSGSVTAIDPSRVSADLAQDHLLGRATVLNCTLAEYASVTRERFDTCVVAMVLQDVVDLTGFIGDLRKVLRRKGRVIAVITHPYFWPQYWKYETAAWFDYGREIFIRSRFKTSRSEYSIETLHVHRPLSAYASALASNGFKITQLLEPVLPARLQRETGVVWEYPHFLVLEASLERWHFDEPDASPSSTQR